MGFIGNSHQFCSISPEILYDEYDIESFMLATSAQTVPMSYYAAMDAIELQHPEVIVFEVSYCSQDFRTVTEEMTHCFFLTACQGVGREKKGINDLVEKENRIYYYLNPGIYHNRWKELTEADYSIEHVSDRGGVYYEDVFANWEISLIDKMELNYATDWKDSQHLNCVGQSKLTRYMVENGYLTFE